MTVRRYRVMHVITLLELGGAQQNTLYCVRHHDRERFDVDLVAGRGGILDDEARSIEDARVDLLDSLVHPIRPLADLRALLRLRALMRRHRVDLVHTHSSKAGILGRLAARLAGVPAVVHTVHGWSFNDTQPGWRRRLYVALERRAARWTDRLVVVSSKNREKGLAHGIGRNEQYRVIHSGIDVAAFARPGRDPRIVREELGLEPGQRLVGTVACLKPQKAPLDFVGMAEEAHRRDPSLRFAIAGDGPLREAVEARIRGSGLDGVVRLLGWRRDVVDLLHAFDVFVLTSLFEGLPRAVLQAMAARVPVVATAVDGTPEVVEEGRTGLLVPAGRPEAIAEGVLRMLGDDGLRRRCIDGAASRLGQAFEIGGMVRDLDRLYLELLEPTRPRSG